MIVHFIAIRHAAADTQDVQPAGSRVGACPSRLGGSHRQQAAAAARRRQQQAAAVRWVPASTAAAPALTGCAWRRGTPRRACSQTCGKWPGQGGVAGRQHQGLSPVQHPCCCDHPATAGMCAAAHHTTAGRLQTHMQLRPSSLPGCTCSPMSTATAAPALRQGGLNHPARSQLVGARVHAAVGQQADEVHGVAGKGGGDVLQGGTKRFGR